MLKRLNSYFIRSGVIPEIYLLTICFYFSRTIFPLYKYLFLFFGVLSLIGIIRMKRVINFKIISSFKLPFILLLFYFLGFILSSHVYSLTAKELVNAILVLFLVINLIFVSNIKIHFNKLLLYFSIMTGLTGFVALIRFLIVQIFDMRIPFSEYLFSSEIFSLVSDKNVYSLYFLFTLVIVTFLLEKGLIKKTLFIIITIISNLNILLSLSRRGYLFYMFLFIFMVILILFKVSKSKFSFPYKVHFIVFFSLLLSASIVYVKYEYFIYTRISKNISNVINLHKLATLTGSNQSFDSFYHSLNREVNFRYWKNFNSGIVGNLFYNGNLENGLQFWGKISGPEDNVTQNIISENGTNILRIERISGTGYWQLLYQGRPIYYYKDLTYTISFDYRVIKGEGVPFCVGWWVFEKGNYLHNLTKHIEPIDSSWNRCKVTCIFEKNHINPACLINYQKSNTIIDIKDIQLNCSDSLNRKMFLDQFDQVLLYGNNAMVKDTVNNLITDSRFLRWKFALKIWKDKYTLIQKLFGGGFDYLTFYGEEFYNNPKRYDYPHNPIISAFLYSGAVGGIYYVFLLVYIFLQYWQYKKDYIVFFMLYILSFLFIMASGNSHFSFPLFMFLSFFPFYQKCS